ncbi:MAG: hypothetical protein P8186_30510 [Anaerolineae bacterium]
MMQTTAVLARTITWAGSKQTYYIARLMVDKDLVDDFFRAYAYFRWVDDIVDASASNDRLPRSDGERISFIKRQGTLIDQLYRNERPDTLAPEEEMIADLIAHSREEHSGLRSFIRNMFAPPVFHRQSSSLSGFRQPLPGSQRCSHRPHAPRYDPGYKRWIHQHPW